MEMDRMPRRSVIGPSRPGVSITHRVVAGPLSRVFTRRAQALINTSADAHGHRYVLSLFEDSRMVSVDTIPLRESWSLPLQVPLGHFGFQ
ncbi:hypothetical protein EYF80_028775 [Liparis tanakae]|uniref:Uncharacterized protein n=1 Tax=Liparis tanakae TaxID=230148 RepID=A0A4Z2H554_9TELE|nr:hypothetical protein EYF80_028775 [Liparis tanakae]